jgi:hypothetical protein
MPKYSNDPRTDAGRTLKKGGSVKKYDGGGVVDRITKGAVAVAKTVTPSNKVNRGIVNGINHGIIKSKGSLSGGIKDGLDPLKPKPTTGQSTPTKKATSGITGKSQSTAQPKPKAMKSTSKPMPKAQFGKIVKTAAKYIKPTVGAAKSATKSAKVGVKQLSDKFKKVKLDNYNKKTANLKRSEDWEKFKAAESDKKLQRALIGIAGGSTALALYPNKKESKKK